MSLPMKLAAIREPGIARGDVAPCWFTCPDCDDRFPAFKGRHACKCGVIWDPKCWQIGEPS